MKRQNGFTLIELLAVIVILAIIAVIAVPIVLNIIDETKENANKRSIDMYAKAVENAIARYQLNKGETPDSYNEVKDYIEYNGSEVVCDDFRIYSDGTTYLNYCTVDGKYVEHSKGNPIGNESLADNILKQYDGANNIAEIDTKKQHRVVSTFNWEYSNSIYFGTDYEYKNGEYTLSGELVKATVQECREGRKEDGTAITCGKYTLDRTDLGSYYFLREIIDFGESGNQLETNNIDYLSEVENLPNSEYSKLLKTADDLGTSYYYRGNVKNNYVKFGTYPVGTKLIKYKYEDEYCDWCSTGEEEITLTQETPIYWRIVRINGDGTLRLAYDGIELVENGVSHTDLISLSKFNLSSEDLKYVGYTYTDGEQEIDSEVKKVVDKWYTDYLENKYGKYISDAIFCNDREITSINENYDMGDGDFIDIYTFAPSNRNNDPILTCKNKKDRYTINQNIGNGLLSKPVGLLTSDEIIFAGEQEYGWNSDSYLSTAKSFWTMSPAQGLGGTFMVYRSESTYGLFDLSVVSYSTGVRPVINLKADVKFKGNGTITSPYEIIVE